MLPTVAGSPARTYNIQTVFGGESTVTSLTTASSPVPFSIFRTPFPAIPRRGLIQVPVRRDTATRSGTLVDCSSRFENLANDIHTTNAPSSTPPKASLSSGKRRLPHALPTLTAAATEYREDREAVDESGVFGSIVKNRPHFLH